MSCLHQCEHLQQFVPPQIMETKVGHSGAFKNIPVYGTLLSSTSCSFVHRSSKKITKADKENVDPQIKLVKVSKHSNKHISVEWLDNSICKNDLFTIKDCIARYETLISIHQEDHGNNMQPKGVTALQELQSLYLISVCYLADSYVSFLHNVVNNLNQQETCVARLFVQKNQKKPTSCHQTEEQYISHIWLDTTVCENDIFSLEEAKTRYGKIVLYYKPSRQIGFITMKEILDVNRAPGCDLKWDYLCFLEDIIKQLQQKKNIGL